MQQVLAFAGEAVAVEFLVGSHAPHIGGDAVFVFQDLGGFAHFVQESCRCRRAVRCQLGVFRRACEPIHALENAFLHSSSPSGIGGMALVLVHQRDVIENASPFLIHAADAVPDDDREFVGVGRIIGDQVRDRVGQQLLNDRPDAASLRRSSVVRPAVPPSMKPRARMSAASQTKSPTRCWPNIE